MGIDLNKKREVCTDRSEKSVDLYLSEVDKIPLITQEEEVDLAQQIKKGDSVALEKLVKANLRFVVSVAKEYQFQGLALPDLINEGNLGLIKAAQKFDETRGFKFISYAVWWIRQSILQALAEQSRLVRLPLNKIGKNNKAKKARNELEKRFGREPTPEEIAEALDILPKKINGILHIGKSNVHLDAPINGEGDNTSMIDRLESPPDEQKGLEWEAVIELIKDVLKKLKEVTPVAVEIFEKKYFGFESPTNKALARSFGISDTTINTRLKEVKKHVLTELKRILSPAEFVELKFLKK
ncbi:sigma-70 family RNA polymerase sigma factor [bacterium]|jgi:RNA polymerase primary sigma factor|nr:sigma-70 family RNA polymerase sigma factor [bacterium]MBT6831465.1 sigma-70 family RNA polymerase sigma factor [bacterium]MBT6996490.1 sigma-70 family RNA polymerase sigma factor [bacterium]MBT7772698.1 sigma-70 family RNA polymerase sigma factor [bacterium]